MARLFVNLPIIPAPAVGYSGPGDVVSGATAWWGLRAYSSASIGTNAIRLREDGTNTEQDFATIAGGGLPLTAIDAFRTSFGGTNLFVTKLYDQTGGGSDLIQAAGANQPTFTLAGLGSQPIIGFVAASALVLVTSATITMSQPFSWSFVAIRTANFSAYNNILCDAAGSTNTLGFANSPNNVILYAGSVPTVAATDNVWHAVQGVFNGASSDLNVDGTSNTVSPGANNLNGTVSFGGGPGNNATGNAVEGGMWGGGVTFSPAQSSNMSANQHSYWGF